MATPDEFRFNKASIHEGHSRQGYRTPGIALDKRVSGKYFPGSRAQLFKANDIFS